MTISPDDYEIFKKAGFIDLEIEVFSEARDPSGAMQPPINIHDETWSSVLQTRKDWVEGQKSYGFDKDQIYQMILDYYNRSSRRSPWDFIKSEYKAGMNPTKVDYLKAARKRAKAKTSKMGKYQGRFY